MSDITKIKVDGETESSYKLFSKNREFEKRAGGSGGTDISLGLTSAAVGQIIKVKAIDESGKPTAWEAVDMPSGGGGGEITTLHINVTALNLEKMEATFTADKTPTEMRQAAVNGPVWCVVTIAAGLMGKDAVSIGLPPAWLSGTPAFGSAITYVHDNDGNNKIGYAVRAGSEGWLVDLTRFAG